MANKIKRLEEALKKAMEALGTYGSHPIIEKQVKEALEYNEELDDKNKINVFSREECVFEYCPHPKLCRDKCVAI